MKLPLLVLLIGVVTADLSVEWGKFKHDYNKQYATVAEERERKQIFLENLEEMLAFQKAHPSATFTTGINHLFDRRMEELTRGRRLHAGSSIIPSKRTVDVKNLPESLDWRERGVLTPVNDQLGTIITAVVSTEVVESLHAIETGQVIQGSIGQVFDCCPQPADAFDCIQNMSGICRKEDYPAPTGKCEPNKCQPFTSFDVIKRMSKPSEDEMLFWIQESTLWAEVNTAGKGFRSYTGGIYDEPTCSKDPIDYVVQIVGYGNDNGTPYWLIRLSWGEKWGEKGYLRMVRGKNMCRVSEVVIQVANTRKGTASQHYASTPIYGILLLLTIVSRLFITSF